MTPAQLLHRIALLAASLGAVAAPVDAHAKPFKGGEIYSVDSIQYGRMEMRMRMARGSGILSTFFTYKNGSELTDTFWEEIDIEVFGKNDATSWQSNIITGLGTRTTSEQDHTAPSSLADDYHTYALEWTPEHVVWEVDGVVVRETSGAQVQDLTSSHSLRFNLWAANIPSWVGEFAEEALPQYQYVNWISFWRYEQGAFVHEWTDDFDSFDAQRWQRADWTFDENLVDFSPENVVVQDGTLVLCLTREGQLGFSGGVPQDEGGSGSGGAGGSASGGSGGGGSSAGGGGSSAGGGGTGGEVAVGGASGGGTGGAGAGGASAAPSGGAASGGAPLGTGGAAAGGGEANGGSGGTTAGGGAPPPMDQAGGATTGNPVAPSVGQNGGCSAAALAPRSTGLGALSLLLAAAGVAWRRRPVRA